MTCCPVRLLLFLNFCLGAMAIQLEIKTIKYKKDTLINNSFCGRVFDIHYMMDACCENYRCNNDGGGGRLRFKTSYLLATLKCEDLGEGR